MSRTSRHHQERTSSRSIDAASTEQHGEQDQPVALAGTGEGADHPGSDIGENPAKEIASLQPQKQHNRQKPQDRNDVIDQHADSKSRGETPPSAAPDHGDARHEASPWPFADARGNGASSRVPHRTFRAQRPPQSTAGRNTWARKSRIEWLSEFGRRRCFGTLLGRHRDQFAMIMRPTQTPPCGSSLLDRCQRKRATIIRIERVSEVINLVTAEITGVDDNPPPAADPMVPAPTA